MTNPIQLDPLPVTGGTLHGVRIVRIRVELEDGRVQKLELPPDTAQAEEKVNTVRFLLDAVALLKPGERLKGEALSGRAGVKWNSYTRNRLASLVREGLISMTDDGYGKAE